MERLGHGGSGSPFLAGGFEQIGVFKAGGAD